MKATEAWWKDRVITISQSQSPDAILQAQFPGMTLQAQSPDTALQGHSPDLIPAWGTAPGPAGHLIFSANGAAYHLGGVVWRECPVARHDGSGLQPLMAIADHFLGRCPKLGWDAPLALEIEMQVAPLELGMSFSNAPKGHSTIARGNAPGNGFKDDLSPEGEIHPWAISMRDIVRRPFRAWNFVRVVFLGRCPRLS